MNRNQKRNILRNSYDFEQGKLLPLMTLLTNFIDKIVAYTTSTLQSIKALAEIVKINYVDRHATWDVMF